MALQDKYEKISGAGSATNAGQTTAILAASVSGELYRIKAGVVSVTLAATGGSGVVTLKDGTTVIQRWDANAIANYPFNYGEDGYPLTSGNALNLVVESAVTNQATAFCSVSGVLLEGN